MRIADRLNVLTGNINWYWNMTEDGRIISRQPFIVHLSAAIVTLETRGDLWFIASKYTAQRIVSIVRWTHPINSLSHVPCPSNRCHFYYSFHCLSAQSTLWITSSTFLLLLPEHHVDNSGSHPRSICRLWSSFSTFMEIEV